MSQEKGNSSTRKKAKHRTADLGTRVLDDEGDYLFPRNACVCEPMPKSWLDDDVSRLIPFRGAFDKNWRDLQTDQPMLDHQLTKNTSDNRKSFRKLLMEDVFNHDWNQRSKAAWNQGLHEESARVSALGGDGQSYSLLGQTPLTQTDVVSLLGSDDTIAFS